jgi:small subunit ribosomal protein S16
MGKKKQPTYRLVAADSRSPRDGRFLEIVGTYAPRGKSTTERDMVFSIDNEKAVKWLSQGAKPTERVERLLKASGAWDEFTSPGSRPAAAATTTAAAEAPASPAEVATADESSVQGEVPPVTEAAAPPADADEADETPAEEA